MPALPITGELSEEGEGRVMTKSRVPFVGEASMVVR